MTTAAASELVVVVDDNPALRDVLVQYIAALGVRVLSIEPENARQVATAIVRCNPHVVLLDLALGTFDGIEVAALVRACRFAGVLVAMTGWNFRERAGEGPLSDFDLYWAKPVEPDTIKAFLLPASVPLRRRAGR